MSAHETKTALWRVNGVELPVGAGEPELLEHVARELGLDAREFLGFRLVKKALDARRFHGVHRLRFVYHVEVALPARHRSAALSRAEASGRVRRVEAPVEPRIERVHASLVAPRPARVAVVGAGPAGLFAALVLARHGLAVTLVDRGSAVERRSRELVHFHRSRTPDPESNLLFGEGGAGTYSDGKLYTRVDDPLEHALLQELVTAGADASILYDSRAHIGTDKLHRILPALRGALAAAGAEFAWNTRVDGFVGASGGRVRALATTRGELPCGAVVFAPGHSARDTWSALHAQGVAFEAKPFQLGVRIEHPQELVTRAQHGAGPDAELLGAASYALVAREEAGARAAHSFCMCPGGRIVASVNEPGLLCTNGMSNSRHSSRWANAAVVVTLGPADFAEFGAGPFAGVALQRALEARFFAAGGGDYTAPAQRAPDFLAGRNSTGTLATSYRFGARPERVDLLLPPTVRDALRRALARFDRTIPGFAGPDGLFVGLESRSSGPVRMPRDAVTRRAAGVSNLYPAGEGAGWAGGIMSAALDGARSALALLEHGL
ncbi:MAG: FAD-dependent monooxygenase [Planctomycetes bacterium]|nr:FAD-dependent monooxygenase [Planctomycetota bacterium]